MNKFYGRCILLMFMTFMSVGTFAQNTVTGIVSDNSGTLPGATVQVKGTNIAAQTNGEGRYTIQASPSSVLVFSMLGFEKQETTVGERSQINVTLVESASELEEVVVTAMGIKREERKLGYAVSTVSSKEILQASPTNAASALYGKATGVSINTNAGGATSAVSIDIRGGMNSIGFQRQPLLVVDGIITRNEEVNNAGFWGDQRIRGNGILDINPENIESINILKGAAASALYGSDAASGVIVITTKSGTSANGFGVDFSGTYGLENVGILPDYQTDFGPGYERTINKANFGATNEGFLRREVRNGRIWIGDPSNPNTVSVPAPAGYSDGDFVDQPLLNAWGQFGPRFDGRDVLIWDGVVRPYVAYKDNARNFYRTGHSGIVNLAIYNNTEKGNYRLAYTRNDYLGIMEGGPQGKNTFSLNSNYKITPKLNVDLVASYMNEHVNNRAYMVDRMTNNYTGFLGAGNNIDWFKEKYKTSKGFRYVTSGDRAQDPEEAFIYNTAGVDYMNYFWDQRERQYDEYTNRLMASTTLNYQVLENLSLRGRLGTDYTSYTSDNKEPNTVPLSVGNSGYYSTAANKYNFLYGDFLASYTNNLSDNIGLNIQLGYQARQEEFIRTSQNTEGGLSQVNWYSLSASNQNTRGYSNRSTLVKDGLFGVLGFDINNYLFIEGSLRQERTSTLFPGNNVFYYPSVSAAFELSNAFNLPSFINYSKLRSSFGIVGNPPNLYAANMVYNAQVVSGSPSLLPPISYGNNQLKNETKRELEFGLETRLLNNRLGFDISYYTNETSDMITQLAIPSSTGASSIIQNVGSMRNHGVELGLNFSPVKTDNFEWSSTFNVGFNRNKILSLAPGLEYLEHSNIDNGSLYIRSKVGEAAGDIWGYTLTRNDKNELVVDEDGFYMPDYDRLVRLGNIQAKAVGGFLNNFTFKNFNLNTVIDYRYGGKVISPSIQYGRSAGMFKETLFGRDAATGGLPYYVDGSGNFVAADGLSAGPSGQPVFHDGMVLDGVTESGSQNQKIVESAKFYRLSNYWGSYPGSGLVGTYENAVFDNNYIRLRELTVSYTLPKGVAAKLKSQNVTISAYGRNLFFLYKTLPHYDAEATIGTNWITRSNVGNAGAIARSFGITLRSTF